MKQIILLITCLILLSCQHKPKKEKQSFLDTINFDKWECFLDKVEYKFTNLDSISPEFVTKFRREKNEGTSYDFYKLTPEQIKSLLTKEEHYSDVSYGLYVVSKQYEENGLLGIVVFFWMDCEYYGQLLIVDKNCKLIDRFTVFSELNCPNPGDSDEEKTPLNIDHQIFTHFLSESKFRTVKLKKVDYEMKADSSTYTEVDSTVYDCSISAEGKINEEKRVFKYKL